MFIHYLKAVEFKLLHPVHMLNGFTPVEFIALHNSPKPLDDKSKAMIKPYDLGLQVYTINTKQPPLCFCC